MEIKKSLSYEVVVEEADQQQFLNSIVKKVEKEQTARPSKIVIKKVKSINGVVVEYQD